MSSDLMLDVGTANELKMSFRRNGYTEADVKKLGEGALLAEILKVIRGQAEIKNVDYVIDCDADPFVPENLLVEEHQKGGVLKWTKDLVTLHLIDAQTKGCIKGHKFREELKGKPVLNACILDFLLKHPVLIPEAWKRKAIFFWGTVYSNSVGRLCVRYLCWGEGRWEWSFKWLDFDWDDDYPAALRAS